MDVNFNYEVGDMVKFMLTGNSSNVFHGVVYERWRSKLDDNKVGSVKLYRILCLERRMAPYTVVEQLIVEKTDGKTN